VAEFEGTDRRAGGFDAAQAQLLQRLVAGGGQQQAMAGAAMLRIALKDCSAPAEPRQTDRRRQAGDAATDDQGFGSGGAEPHHRNRGSRGGGADGKAMAEQQ
jgi:hypothetical protein